MPTLKELRENAGLSPTQVAAKANVSVAFLYKAEAGKEAVSRTLVARLCSVLGTDIRHVQGLNLRD